MTTLLLVDVQKDFHPNGSLAIPTANEDAARIAELIRSSSSKISRIVATLDSHHKLHIAHPQFWISNNNNNGHPVPFTIITSDDIIDGKWKPNPAIRLPPNDDGTLDTTIFTMDSTPDTGDDNNNSTHTLLSAYVIEYTKRLEAKGRFQLCIWPEHCLMGSVGHCIVDTVWDAMQEWSSSTGGTIEWVYKGQNLLTEMYSALEAEIPVSPSTQFNTKLQSSLEASDQLLVCGQAMSHCVNYTLRDIVKHWSVNAGDKSTITLLTDCASAVPGFESAADVFQEDMKKEGVTLKKSNEVFL